MSTAKTQFNSLVAEYEHRESVAKGRAEEWESKLSEAKKAYDEFKRSI